MKILAGTLAVVVLMSALLVGVALAQEPTPTPDGGFGWHGFGMGNHAEGNHAEGNCPGHGTTAPAPEGSGL